MTRQENRAADALARWMRREHESTLRTLKTLGAQYVDFRSHPKALTAGEVARHMVGSQRGFITRLKGEVPQRFEMPGSWEDLIDASERFFRAGVRYVESLGDAGLVEQAHYEGRKRVRLDVLYEMVSHEIHHRAQLAGYIRLLDLPVPEIYAVSTDTGEKMA
jgi:uncharacterized damage-inducible protein DinB